MTTPQALTSDQPWTHLNDDADCCLLLETDILPPYANTCRWFAGKARQQEAFRIRQMHQIPMEATIAYLFIMEVRYADGDTESYQLPVSFVDIAAPNAPDIPAKGIITVAYFQGQRGLLVDGIYDERFRLALFHHLTAQSTLRQEAGQVTFQRGRGLAGEDINAPASGRVLPVDSSNSALVYNEKYFLKLYRKLFSETNPEVDMVSFLTENSDFAHIPAYAGGVVWQRPDAPDVTLGMMQRMVENEKDSWAQTGDYLNDFLYAVPNRLFAIKEDVFDKVELLARRTAEMHLALYKPGHADEPTDPAFAPEQFTDDYRVFIIGRLEHLLERRYSLLVDNYQKLDPLAQRLAWVFMEAKEMIDEFVADFRTRPLESLRVRIHGDYHLGQVLATAPDRSNDFIIIDFEGEPESSITERKIKHSPLKDVAGMIRSYHYAVCAKLFNSAETEGIDSEHLQRVSDRWFRLIRDTYVDTYLETFGSPHPLFKDNTEINFLLLVYLLEKAVYELGYEISYRPAWVKIPLKGIVDVIREIEKIRMADTSRSADVPRLQTGLLQTKKA